MIIDPMEEFNDVRYTKALVDVMHLQSITLTEAQAQLALGYLAAEMYVKDKEQEGSCLTAMFPDAESLRAALAERDNGL